MGILNKIRAYVKGQQINKVRLFLIGNLGLFVIAGVIWVQPALSSLANYRDVIQRQQHMYDYYTRQVTAYGEDIEGLIEHRPRRVMDYGQLAAAMAYVRGLALYYDLDITLFNAAQPLSHDGGTDADQFVELRLSAMFEGERSAEFVRGLGDNEAFIRRLRLEIPDDGAQVLSVEFSFFGR
ncbi:MAG: hypothetical protein FWE42_03380 [Defluviitaleaceae bacterium]|nr:hypothetical protein [Defluviitaleaceae bacterium]